MGVFRVTVRSWLGIIVEGYIFARVNSFGRLLSLYIDGPDHGLDVQRYIA